MKLITLVLRSLSIAMFIILTLWAGFFYMAVMEEVNDEIDDSLEDYAEMLIIRHLSGEELPKSSSNTNNQFYLHEVSHEYAASRQHITYHDEMVYIDDKREDEPARVLTYIYLDDNGQHMELVVYTPTIEKSDLLKEIAAWLAVLFLILLLTIILINVWVFHRNLRPLYRMLHWLDRYRPGKKVEPLNNPTRIYEFQRLNDSLMSSVERSEELFEQQKLFVGNASHEMQTPLAICLNRLEMLMDDESLNEHQMNELVKMSDTLRGLTKLNRSLLLLCRIDNGQFSDIKSISINDMFRRYIPDYREVYAYKNILVELSEMGTMKVNMSEMLASLLVTNLLKNAFVHTDYGGKIDVCLKELKFEVFNSGNEPLNSRRVFERFYQSKRKEGSTGLGLALLQSICKSSQLHVDYSFNAGMHCFSVQK